MDNFFNPEEQWVIDQLLDEEGENLVQDLIGSMWGAPNEVQGSGRSANIDRDRLAGHERIMKDYFAEVLVYTDGQFRRRFWMHRHLFLRIMERVVEHDGTFQQRCDATRVVGLSSIQKITCALRMLAYGSAANQLDEYICIGESTALMCLQRFCKAIIQIFSNEYLRTPTAEDTQRILAFNQSRGFPGMMGSIECMHWRWKNCPRAWASAFQGKLGKPTIVLEAIASYDLWIWHALFRMSGSCNDLNILNRSPLFVDQVQGAAPKCSYRVNGNEYTQTYLLTDGIYPEWATFVKTISNPQGEKRKYFSKMQESARKDVECCFAVLQEKWAIIHQHARTWTQTTLSSIMKTCIILHNLIVEDERGTVLNDKLDTDMAGIRVERVTTARDNRLPSMNINRLHLRDQQCHHELQHDLIEHLWSKKGKINDRTSIKLCSMISS